jgi:uncharacterized protein (UPF0332 family)
VTWTELLATDEVKKHKTSKSELDKIRIAIRRDLADASLDGLSADRGFATAYNAALQAAKMAIACAGYRVTTGAGHHRISFEAVKLAIGTSADSYADYFDRCRRKRNVIDYDDANVATETEAQELVAKAKDFRDLVEQWIAKNYPQLKA